MAKSGRATIVKASKDVLGEFVAGAHAVFDYILASDKLWKAINVG